MLDQQDQHPRCVVRRLGRGLLGHRARLHCERADQQTGIDVRHVFQGVGQRAIGLAQLGTRLFHDAGEHLLIDLIHGQTGEQVDASRHHRVDLRVEDRKGRLLPTLQRLEPVLRSDEDEIDLPRNQALAGRIEIIGDLDQIDALAKCLVQLGGIDANGRSVLLRHYHGSEGLGQLLIAEPKEKENQERPQYQRGDQPGLSPDGNQLFAKEGEAPGQ